jgi:hypothetical protein
MASVCSQNSIGYAKECSFYFHVVLFTVSFFQTVCIAFGKNRTIVPIVMFDKSTKIYRSSMPKVNVVWDGAQCGMPPADFFP